MSGAPVSLSRTTRTRFSQSKSQRAWACRLTPLGAHNAAGTNPGATDTPKPWPAVHTGVRETKRPGLGSRHMSRTERMQSQDCAVKGLRASSLFSARFFTCSGGLDLLSPRAHCEDELSPSLKC